MTGPEDCPFCDKGRIRSHVSFMRGLVLKHWVMVFEPLDPVTEGHRLVVPVKHVRDAVEDPFVTAEVMGVVAIVAAIHESSNIITSIGEAATQSVGHLHVHVIPRRPGDGLHLPWTT